MPAALVVDTHCHATETYLADAAAGRVRPAVHDRLLDGCRHRTLMIVSDVGRGPVAGAGGAVESVRCLDRIISAYPEIMHGSVMVDPNRAEDAMEAIGLGVGSLGMRGIGEMVQYMHGWTTDGPEVLPVMLKAVELGVPINFHAAGDEHGDGVMNLAEAFPRARVIMAHTGGRCWRTVTRAAARLGLPNLWLEVMVGDPTQAGQPGIERIAGAIEAVGPGRVVYGSDFFLENDPDLRYGMGNALLDALDELGVDDATAARVAGLNALELFGLEAPGGS